MSAWRGSSHVLPSCFCLVKLVTCARLLLSQVGVTDFGIFVDAEAEVDVLVRKQSLDIVSSGVVCGTLAGSNTSMFSFIVGKDGIIIRLYYTIPSSASSKKHYIRNLALFVVRAKALVRRPPSEVMAECGLWSAKALCSYFCSIINVLLLPEVWLFVRC